MTQSLPKVILDTSVFVAALLSKNSQSSSPQVLDAWRNSKFTLVMSPQLLQELIVILNRQRISLLDIQSFVTVIAKTSLFIHGAYETTILDNIDPNDNVFLAAAYEAKANYLVSLDRRHLLPLKYFHGTQILSPSLFLRML